jgi:hypothetical protein
VHDLGRSAIRNLIAISVSGHKAFDRYYIVDAEDAVLAMKRVQQRGVPQ